MQEGFLAEWIRIGWSSPGRPILDVALPFDFLCVFCLSDVSTEQEGRRWRSKILGVDDDGKVSETNPGKGFRSERRRLRLDQKIFEAAVSVWKL